MRTNLGKLNPNELTNLIKRWDRKTLNELSKELKVSKYTIQVFGGRINKLNPDLCKRKVSDGDVR